LPHTHPHHLTTTHNNNHQTTTDPPTDSPEWARVVQADRAKLRFRWCRSQARIDQLVEALAEELPRIEAQVRELQEELMDWHVR